MIPSWARVGARVVCVDDRAPHGRVFYYQCPPAGTECIITGYSSDIADGTPTVTVRGFPNCLDEVDTGWRVSRFRPLITQSDDLATHFEQHLRLSNPVREEA